jgi:glycosyltransferase involved in cell wall biosynthesis
MKILYLVHQFYPEFYTGTEKFVYNIALMTQKFGNKVKVITYSFYEDTYYDKSIGNILSKDFIYKGIPVLAFKFNNPPYDLHFGLENKGIVEFAENVIKTEKPDIVHVGHPMRVHEFIKAAIKLNIPYIITLTDFFLMCPKIILTTSGNLCIGPQNGITCSKMCKEFSEIYIKNRLKQAEYIFMNAQRILSPSKFVASMFKKEFSNLKVDINNHGIRYKNIKTNRRVYNKNEKQIIFGYGGSLTPHKGISVLLKAFNELNNKDIKLKIYGSGQEEYVNKLKNIVKCDDRVEFCGVFSEEQVGDILSLIDVIVVPSTCYESYSFILHEALACNVPVIVSNLGGMAEKIKDGFNGYTFEAGNYKSLKEKMEFIINNPDVLNKIKENIKRNIIIPTVEQEAYNYLKIYENLYNVKYSEIKTF